ncbi:GNAT family N-acetyltransferase [Streptomyces goshikiensis]|uniref:GNAT family N-acetyltransferase n=1 Tax=Streptomyces goshikiensis TaxID=1942 RepID=UPI0036570A52
MADTGSTVVGLLVLNRKELKQLYLDPAWRGRGLGDRFMSLAEQQKPDGLTLSTFQFNAAARRFYERHGFVEVAPAVVRSPGKSPAAAEVTVSSPVAGEFLGWDAEVCRVTTRAVRTWLHWGPPEERLDRVRGQASHRPS